MFEAGRREGFGHPRRRLIWCLVWVLSPILKRDRVEEMVKRGMKVKGRFKMDSRRRAVFGI